MLKPSCYNCRDGHPLSTRKCRSPHQQTRVGWWTRPLEEHLGHVPGDPGAGRGLPGCGCRAEIMASLGRMLGQMPPMHSSRSKLLKGAMKTPQSWYLAEGSARRWAPTDHSSEGGPCWAGQWPPAFCPWRTLRILLPGLPQSAEQRAGGLGRPNPTSEGHGRVFCHPSAI